MVITLIISAIKLSSSDSLKNNVKNLARTCKFSTVGKGLCQVALESLMQLWSSLIIPSMESIHQSINWSMTASIFLNIIGSASNDSEYGNLVELCVLLPATVWQPVSTYCVLTLDSIFIVYSWIFRRFSFYSCTSFAVFLNDFGLTIFPMPTPGPRRRVPLPAFVRPPSHRSSARLSF